MSVRDLEMLDLSVLCLFKTNMHFKLEGRGHSFTV